MSDFIQRDADGVPRLDKDGDPIVSVPVEGTFGCQLCYVYCDVAYYVPKIKALTWQCPDGHVSIIEDFIL